MPHRKRIPAQEQVPFERWEMPDLTGIRRRIKERLNELGEDEPQEETQPPEPPPPTPEEIEALVEEARQQGYAQGHQEGTQAGYAEGKALGYQDGETQGQEAGFQLGYEQGLNQGQQEIDQQLARLHSLIEQLQGPLQRLEQDVEAGLLSLVDVICRALLRREISINRDFLAQVLRDALAALPPGHERLRVFINPQDQQLVEALHQELLEDWRLVLDPQIAPGGARVETLQSLVDSTLENRYKKIIDSLLDAGYQLQAEDLSPLPREVLAEPDPLPAKEPTQPTPLPESDALPAAEGYNPEDFRHQQVPAAEPDAPEPEPIAAEEAGSMPEAPPVEPVTRVSLQRNSAPRELPPLEDADFPAEPASDAGHDSDHEPELDPEDRSELDGEEVPSAEPEVQDQLESNITEQEPVQSGTDEDADGEDLAREPQPPLTDEDEEDFFEKALGELEADVDLSATEEPLDEPDRVEVSEEAPSLAEALSEQASEPEKTAGEEAPSVDVANQEPVAAEEPSEKAWAPDSVHEERYLDDPEAVMESTWHHDLQENESLGDEAESTGAEDPDAALDELLKFDEDEQADEASLTEDPEEPKNG